MQKTHTCFEHQRLLLHDLTHANDFQWLIKQVEQQKLPCFSLVVENSQIALKAKHYLAVLLLPSGNLLEILPKIDESYRYPIHASSDVSVSVTKTKSHNVNTNNLQETRMWVTRMLMDIYSIGFEAKTLPLLSQAHLSTLQSSHKSWIEPFIVMWVDSVLTLQPLSHYQQQHQNHPNAQGKLVIKEQIKHNHHRPHYLYTTHQIFQKDPLWGQFFYTVMLKIQQLGFTPNYRLREIIVTMTANVNIRELEPHQWHAVYDNLLSTLLNNKHLDSVTTARTKLALQLGRLILEWHNNQQASGLESYNGTYLPATIIDMNLAFEKWVSYTLNNMYHHTQVQTQHVWLTEKPPLLKNTAADTLNSSLIQKMIQPDMLIFDKNNRVKIVVDIKYKELIQPSQINSADLYQIFTYLNCFETDEAWLVYPKTKNFNKPCQFIFKNKENISNCYIKILPFDCLLGEIIL